MASVSADSCSDKFLSAYYSTSYEPLKMKLIENRNKYDMSFICADLNLEPYRFLIILMKMIVEQQSMNQIM